MPSWGARTSGSRGRSCPGIHQVGTTLHFAITAKNVNVNVVSTGSPPQLFRVGMPVVLDGHWQGNVFSSFQIMVQHGSSYVEAHPGKAKSGTHGHVNIALGQSALLLALLGAVAGAVTLVVGLGTGRPSLLRAGQAYIWLVVAGAVLATVAMQRALITHDFTLVYVDNNDSTFTPLLYRITAMWSDLAGSILLWALVLSGYLAAMWLRFRQRRDEPFVVWAKIVGYAVAAFFFGLMLTASNPFARVHGAVPNQGPGPDPLLQDRALVAFHPPLLYLGLVGFTVPFCLAVAGLVTGRVGHLWLPEARRWAIFAWACLTAGVVLGAWWSYQVLGWGGLLVLGPGRELRSAALADRHRVLALGHGPAKAGHAAGLEPLAPPRHLQPHHPGDVLHPLGGAGVGSLVHRRWRGRAGPARLFRAGGGHFHRAAGVAGRPAAQPGLDRDPGLARGRLPGQQPAVCRLRLRRAAGHRLPAVRRSGERLVDNRGRAVLRHDDDADSPVPAVPYGGGARAAMAPGLG